MLYVRQVKVGVNVMEFGVHPGQGPQALLPVQPPDTERYFTPQIEPAKGWGGFSGDDVYEW